MRRGSLTDRIGDVTESYKLTARVNNLIFSTASRQHHGAVSRKDRAGVQILSGKM